MKKFLHRRLLAMLSGTIALVAGVFFDIELDGDMLAEAISAAWVGIPAILAGLSFLKPAMEEKPLFRNRRVWASIIPALGLILKAWGALPDAVLDSTLEQSALLMNSTLNAWSMAQKNKVAT